VAIFGVLLALSAILAIATLVPAVDVATLAIALAAALGVSLAALALVSSRRPPRRTTLTGERSTWRMPPAALLARAHWSRARFLGMCALRGYSVIAVIALLIKTVEVGTGH